MQKRILILNMKLDLHMAQNYKDPILGFKTWNWTFSFMD